jgi:ABC-type multidrug transport system permease subunit
MNISFSDNIRIFGALTRRDLYILSKQIKNFLIDGTVIIATRVVAFCYLFPVMGMSAHFIGPIYIGSIISLFFNINYAQAMRIVFDLKFNRLIDYQLTLPIKHTWLWIQKIVGIALNVACITAPLIGASIFVLSSQIPDMEPNVLAFIIIYILTLFFYATLCLAFAFNYNYDWFMYNIWPRRLTPLFCFGGVLFPWKAVYAFWPSLGIAFLFNPITYVAEGFRSTLLGSDQYISYPICIALLAGWIGIAWCLLLMSIKKRFNQ